MNLTDEQKRTLRTEYQRTFATSEQLLRQREALWRQALGVRMLDCDGGMTERASAVRRLRRRRFQGFCVAYWLRAVRQCSGPA